MPFSVKITGYSKTDGQTLLEVEPNWWNARDLLHDKRFIESRKNRVCYNYDADLSLNEARKLHEKYKSNVTIIHKWLCFKFRKLSPTCQQLHDALYYRGHNYSHFHVTVSEKESGL